MPLIALTTRHFWWCLRIKLWFILQLKSTREKCLKGKKKFSLRNPSTFLVYWNAFWNLLQHLHFNSVTYVPSVALLNIPRINCTENFIKQMTSTNSFRFFTGEKSKFMDFSRGGFDSCASIKPHRMHRASLHSQPQSSSDPDTVLFILLFYLFFFSRFMFLCAHCHLSSFAFKQKHEKGTRKASWIACTAQHSSLLVP